MNKSVYLPIILSTIFCGYSDVSASSVLSYEIVDQKERKVTIPKEVERVAVHRLLPLPSVYAAYKGGDVSGLVAMPPDSMLAAENSILKKYAPDILKVSTEYFKGGEMNVEELLKMEPDVVMFHGGDKVRQPLENAGLTAVEFSTRAGGTNTIKTVGKWLNLLEDIFREESKVTGIVEYGEKIEQLVSERVRDIPDEQRKKIIIIGFYNSTSLTFGGFSQFYADAVGSINVGKDAKGNVSMEQIYEWDPDMVFLSTLTDVYPDDFFNNKLPQYNDWSGVKAVKEKQVYKYPLGMHRWWPPSTDAPLSLLWVAKNVYPQQFADIDMNDEIIKYFKNFYGMTISDREAESILNTPANVGRKVY